MSVVSQPRELTEWERQRNHDLNTYERGYRAALARVGYAAAEFERDEKIFTFELVEKIVDRVWLRGLDEVEREKRRPDSTP